MKKLLFPIIVILFALLMSILFLLLSSKNNPFVIEKNKNPLSDNSFNQTEENREAVDEANNQEIFFDKDSPNSQGASAGGGGGGGGGGGSSNQGSASSTSSCPQISYSLKNFIKNSVCLSSIDGICTNKEVYCSVSVENMDQSSGEFIIEFSIIEIQTSSIVQQFEISNNVNPGQLIKFEKTTSFQSQTDEGDANKEFDCSFKTIKIPKKQIC